MPKKLNVGAALLAEYVTHGAANKITIVNAYSGNVVLLEYPTTVGFGLYLELQFGKEKMPAAIDFEMLLNGEKLFHGQAGGSPILSENEPATILIQHFQITVEKDSELELYVTADGYERTRAMQKKLSQGPIPSA